MMNKSNPVIANKFCIMMTNPATGEDTMYNIYDTLLSSFQEASGKGWVYTGEDNITYHLSIHKLIITDMAYIISEQIMGFQGN